MRSWNYHNRRIQRQLATKHRRKRNKAARKHRKLNRK